MSSRSNKNLLAHVSPDRYTGRIEEIENLYLKCLSGATPSRVRVSGPPRAGTSEMLRQVFDRLFLDQQFVVPFYFSLRGSDGDARSAAARFIYEFLLQSIAFRRGEGSLIAASPDICELKKLAPVTDAAWVNDLCAECGENGPLDEARAFIRSAAAAPLRAAGRASMRLCIFIDDIHQATAIDGGLAFVDEVIAATAGSEHSVVIGGRRRFTLNAPMFERVEIEPLDRDEASAMAGELARGADLTVSDEARDLIAVQFGGDPFFIGAVIAGAKDRRTTLETYRSVEQAYVAELMAGRIGEHYDRIFGGAVAGDGTLASLIELLDQTRRLRRGANTFSIEELRTRLGMEQEDFARLLDVLTLEEVIRRTGDLAYLADDGTLRDYLRTRSRLNSGSGPAAVSAAALTEALKNAPRLMSREYRFGAAVGLRELLAGFDLQQVPVGVIDYRVFRDEYKGLTTEEVRRRLALETDLFALPQIVQSEPLGDHLPRLASLTEPERAVVGVGFTDRVYRDSDEIAWLAVEVDSKLEADHEAALEWCERLESAAAECGFARHFIWLVAPEGFTPGALDVLAEHNAVGSSRRQVDLLREIIAGGNGPAEQAAEYEITIPVGEDTELISAHALEEISRQYNYPVNAVNQMKTALVEACINAAEHSLSPDKKIYQKFSVHKEKIVVTVSNRGLRLTDKLNGGPAVAEPEGGRRGWGLSLIRSLMDEVRVEAVDDGTRIVMTKYLSN